LRGPAFAGMRKAMREAFDDLWIIDLGGDNLGARKSENVFAIRTPVAIAVGVRTNRPSPDSPAVTHYCGTLIDGRRDEKLERLSEIESLSDLAWEKCFAGWEQPLLPERAGDYFSWPPLTDLFPWQHSGIQFKRTWPICPDREVLKRRWERLVGASAAERAELMRATEAKNPDRESADLLPPFATLPAIAKLDAGAAPVAARRISYRSLDRQWMLPDTRLIDRPRPPLWRTDGPSQIFLTSLLTKVLGRGVAALATALVPDMDCFSGRGAKDVLPLWRDAEASEPNITGGLSEALGGVLGDVSPEEVLAYVYAILMSDYSDRFAGELDVPGPRIPITKDRALFDRASTLGGRLIWLHTYGERLVPEGEKYGVLPKGAARCTVGVPADGDSYPNSFAYDEDRRRLTVGGGVFEPVTPETWNFSVSGLGVLRSWLSYRMKEGAGKRSSPLDRIRPEKWPTGSTEELCRLLWIIEATIEAIPTASALLDEVVDGPVFAASELPKPSKEERAAPRSDENGAEQLALGDA
jgi:hypothetical protein